MPPKPAPPARKRPPRPSGPSGRSGAHTSQRRPCNGTAAQWADWDRKAARVGLTWAAWARALQDGAWGSVGLAEPQDGPFPGRRLLSASDAQWRAWDATARAARLSWADWIRRLMDAA